MESESVKYSFKWSENEQLWTVTDRKGAHQHLCEGWQRFILKCYQRAAVCASSSMEYTSRVPDGSGNKSSVFIFLLVWDGFTSDGGLICSVCFAHTCEWSGLYLTQGFWTHFLLLHILLCLQSVIFFLYFQAPFVWVLWKLILDTVLKVCGITSVCQMLVISQWHYCLPAFALYLIQDKWIRNTIRDSPHFSSG